jgi:hypothetical protein
MFGNLKGWIISLLLFAVTGFLMWSAGKKPPHTTAKQATKYAIAMQPAKIDFDYTTLFPPGTEERDAGDMVRELEDKARTASLQNKFAKLNTAMNETNPAKKDKARRDAVKPLEPLLDELVAASKCSKMTTLFKPNEIVVYDNKPLLKYLTILGKQSSIAGRAYWTSGADNTEKLKGKEYIIAAFHLGRFMYEDRPIVKVYRNGLEIMRDAAFNFGVVETDKKDQVDRLIDAINKKLDPAAGMYGDIANPNINTAPGEVFLIAEGKTPDGGNVDPMWRTEAIMKLGRMRWLKGVDYADQLEANEVLAQIATESNLPPTVKVAVDRAQKLTAADMSNLMDREP